MTLTKELLVEKFKAKFGFQSKEAQEIIELTIELVKGELEKGEEVKISGFGKWQTKQKSMRPGRNPHTGEKIEIHARRVVVFHPADKLRERINSKADA